MIKNKPNFVPAKYELQPEFYMDYFGCIVAVFKHPVNGRNLLLEVNADRLSSNNVFERKGNLQLQYQGEKSRHFLSSEISTLQGAIRAVAKLLESPTYGDSFPDPAILVDKMDGARYGNTVLSERRAKAYKAKCKYFKPKTPFILTEDDKKLLLKCGETEEDIKLIEECANKSVFLLDDEEAITLEKALELTEREEFLSGIARSCFHWTSSRSTKDGKHVVYFESGQNSPFRKNDR